MLTRGAFFEALMFIFLLSFILFISHHASKMIVPPEYTSTSGVSLLYSYGDLDRELCQKTINWNRKSSLASSSLLQCPENENIVSIVGLGRTGNLMWAYASVLAVARQTRLKPYIPSCIKASLEILFDELTLPTFEDIIHCPVKISTFVTSVESWKINPQSIILPRYIVFPKDIIPWIPNIWQEFTFKKIFKDSAQQTLRKLTKSLPLKNYTFVGVHVRRTDYKDYLKRKYNESLVSPQFFLKAMAYFKQKYPDSLFIFVSDDTKWCLEQFGNKENIFVVTDNQNKKNGQVLDLAVMVACNHTIYDYGTFGEWGGILARGEVVCYDMIQNSKEGSMQYNNSWRLMI